MNRTFTAGAPVERLNEPNNHHCRRTGLALAPPQRKTARHRSVTRRFAPLFTADQGRKRQFICGCRGRDPRDPRRSHHHLHGGHAPALHSH